MRRATRKDANVAAGQGANQLDLKEPIFLLGSHKSGSSLLRSLLDGCESLVVLPSEAHFFQYAGYWVDYPLRAARPREMELRERAVALLRFIDEENRCSDPYGASDMADRYDQDAFRTVMQSFCGEDVRSLFVTYVYAILGALNEGEALREQRLVEKSVENAEFAPTLHALFPDCKFIHIIRNPYATLVAIRKARSKAGYPYLRDMLLSICNSYQHLYKNRLTLPNYLVVCYEDLVNDTREVMQSVAEFLGIEFRESLLSPTILGQSWHGNSTSDRRFTGVSTEALDHWKNSVTDLEIRLVNNKLGQVMQQYGYERISPRHHWIRQWLEPARRESPSTYVKNRLLGWLL